MLELLVEISRGRAVQAKNSSDPHFGQRDGDGDERRDFVGDVWVTAASDYLTTRRGFSLNASYRYRF
jgi:hypothetical protein